MSHHQYHDCSLPSARLYSRPPSPPSVTLQAPLDSFRLPLSRSRPSSPHPPLLSPSTERHGWISDAQGSNWDDVPAEPLWGRSPRKAQRSATACIRCRELKIKCDWSAEGSACRRCKGSNALCTTTYATDPHAAFKDEILARMSALEGRVHKVESRLSTLPLPSPPLDACPPAASSVSTSALENRLQQLEALLGSTRGLHTPPPTAPTTPTSPFPATAKHPTSRPHPSLFPSVLRPPPFVSMLPPPPPRRSKQLQWNHTITMPPSTIVHEQVKTPSPTPTYTTSTPQRVFSPAEQSYEEAQHYFQTADYGS